MNPVSPQVSSRITFAGFCVTLIGVAITTNSYFRPLNPDEVTYYAPAITFVSQSMPQLPLRDYPFPGPPFALWIQAFIATIFGGLTSVRFLSSFCAVCLAAYFFFNKNPQRRISLLGRFAILTFPFFLWNAFTIKQHVLTTSFLLVGLDRWFNAEASQSNRNYALAGLFFSAAALSNQFCAPFCAAIGFEQLRRMHRSGGRIPLFFSLLPLFLLGVLLLYWGGKQPPAYVDPLPATVSTGWRSGLAQLALGAVTVGAWLGAISFDRSLHLRTFLIAWPPSVAVVWLSGLYSTSGDFWTVGQGPISKIISTAFGFIPALIPVVAGSLAALAVTFWIAPGVGPQWTSRVRIVILLYLGVVSVAVPYLFESYYLLLIAPLLFVLLNESPTLGGRPLRTILFLGGMIFSGVVYTVFKLTQSS